MSGKNLVEWLMEAPLQVGAHAALLREERDWGGPTSYRALCKCGWESLEYVNCSPTILVKELQDFVDKWGMDQYVAISRSSYDENASSRAIHALLTHLAYKPEVESKRLEREMKETFYSFQKSVKQESGRRFATSGVLSEDMVDLFHNLQELSFRYSRLQKMATLIQEQASLALPVVELEAYKEYKKLMKTLGGHS